MGNVAQQFEDFKLTLTQSLNLERFNVLSERLKQSISPKLLELILKDAEVKLNAPLNIHYLQNCKPGEGYVYLRKYTRKPFDYYIGRNFDGAFQLILIPNSKDDQGSDISAKQKKLNELFGTYKIGKDAKGIILVGAASDQYFRLTTTNATTFQTEKHFSNIVDSPHVARYLSSQEYNGKNNITKMMLLMPKAQKGDFNKMIFGKSRKFFFDYIEYLVIIYGMISGVRHIHNTVQHEYSMTNRDIKIGNMVLTEDNRVLIIDHGSWQKTELDSTYYLNARTAEYCSPFYLEFIQRINIFYKEHEVFKKAYSKSFWEEVPENERKKWKVWLSGKCEDVWGLGVCIYEFLANSHPTAADVKNLDNDQHGYLKAMLQADAQKRCTSDTALQLFINFILQQCGKTICEEWLNCMMSLYKNNDYYRTRFLSELYLAGFDGHIQTLPEELREPMPFEKLLDWDTNLSLSEWYRFRALYERFLKNEELEKFDEKLKKRPEFEAELMAGSVANAIRTNNHKVLQIIKEEKYNTTRYFDRVSSRKNRVLAEKICAMGYGPWHFNVKLGFDALSWWLHCSVDVLIKMGAYAIQDSRYEIIEHLKKHLPDIIDFILTTDDPRIEKEKCLKRIDEMNVDIWDVIKPESAEKLISYRDLNKSYAKRYLQLPKNQQNGFENLLKSHQGKEEIDFKSIALEIITEDNLTLNTIIALLEHNISEVELIEMVLNYRSSALPTLEDAGISVGIYFSNQCNNFTTIARQISSLKKNMEIYHKDLSVYILEFLSLKIKKLEALIPEKSSFLDEWLPFYKTTTAKDSEENKLLATKIIEANTMEAINAVSIQEPPQKSFLSFSF